MIEFTYSPDWPSIAIAATIATALLFASYSFAKGRASWVFRVAFILLRLVAIGLILLCLLNPQRVDEKKHQPKSRVAVLVDTSRSMSISDVPGGRLAAAKRWVQEQLSPAVPKEVSVSQFTFDQTLHALEKFDFASPTGGVTALGQALESVLAVPGDDPLLGVIVCSDGSENFQSDPEAAARAYRRKGIPIHTFAVGTTNDMRDIVLANVQVKRAVPNQAPTKVTFTLRAAGYENQTVPIQVRQKERIVAVKEVKLTGKEQQVELEFTPREKGFQTFEASIPNQKGEWLASNNRRMFGLEVIDPTIRVLYLEGTPHQPNVPVPEWAYLKEALESDKNIKVKVLTRQLTSRTQRTSTVETDPDSGEAVYPVEHPRFGFPKTLDELLQYDVVIHSDIRKESFTPEQLQNIAKLVEEFSGGFVMIGGNSAFGKGGYHKTVLDRIIPVAMEQSADADARLIELRVIPRGWQHPLIALGATRPETEAIWTTKFPKLYGCNGVDHAKPGAMILAVDPARRNSYGSALLIAAQQIGKGRSLAFTSDTTRSWGRDFETLWGEPKNPALPLSEENCDSRYYRRFWVNAVRWLAAGKIGKTNNAVNLELAQSYAGPNEKVMAKINVRDIYKRDISGADVSVRLSAKGKEVASFKANYDPASRSYLAQIVPEAAGEFTATATATLKGQALGDDQQLLVSESVDREMADVRANPGLMERLAKLSGGRSFTTANTDMGAITAAFANAPEMVIDLERHPLWDRAWMLVTVLGLLSAEWAGRRWRGLA